MNLTKADKAFSDYIRQRDAINGIVKCCTCQTVLPWKEMQCGHFRKRGNLATRWNEVNAAAQCVICNQINDGEYHKMMVYLVRLFGGDEVMRVIDKSFTTWKPMQYEIDELEKYYKNKIKQL